MSDFARFNESGRRCCKRLVNAERLFPPAIGLTRNINDEHKRRLFFLAGLGLDEIQNGRRNSPTFEKTYFTFPSAWITILRIRKYGHEANSPTIDFAVSRGNARDQLPQKLGLRIERLEPNSTPARSREALRRFNAIHLRSPWEKRALVISGNTC